MAVNLVVLSAEIDGDGALSPTSTPLGCCN
jgi:hypothetical protein